MTTGQTRVLVLLIVLLCLEIIRQPAIKSWLQSAWSAIGSGISAGSSSGSKA